LQNTVRSKFGWRARAELNLHPDSALLQVSQVLKLEKPEKYDLERLQEWLKDKDQGALFLHKPEEEIWGKLSATGEKADTSDQVILAVREDHFSRGTATALICLYDIIWGQHRKVSTPLYMSE
jgi:hypothetical protein